MTVERQKSAEVTNPEIFSKAKEIIEEFGETDMQIIRHGVPGSAEVAPVKNVYAPIIFANKQYMLWLRQRELDNKISLDAFFQLGFQNKKNVKKNEKGIVTSFDYKDQDGQVQHIDTISSFKLTPLGRYQSGWGFAQGYDIKQYSLDMYFGVEPGDFWGRYKEPFKKDENMVMDFLDKIEEFQK